MQDSTPTFSDVMIFSSSTNSPMGRRDWFIKVRFVSATEVDFLDYYSLYGDEYDDWPEINLTAYKFPYKGELHEASEGRIVTHFSVSGRGFDKTYTVTNPRHIFGY